LIVAIFAASQLVPRWLPRVGPKPFAVTGAALILAGMLWLTEISATTGYLSGLLGPMLLFGVGVGLVLVPLSLIILSGVQGADSGAASGLLQTMQQVGGSLGIAVLVTRYGSASRDAATHPLANASPKLQAHHVVAEAMGSAFGVAAVIAAVSLLVALVVITTDRTSRPEPTGDKHADRAASERLPEPAASDTTPVELSGGVPLAAD
jgi:MFS family permease